MTRALPAALLLGAVLAAGCSGGESSADPAEGTYQLTTDTENDVDCAAEGPAVTGGDPFFKLQRSSLFGTPFLGYHACTDAATCDPDVDLFGSFFDEGQGWVRKITASSGTSPCSLTLSEGPLVETDTGVRIEQRTYHGSLVLNTGETCEPDLADARRAELVCDNLRVTVATRVP